MKQCTKCLLSKPLEQFYKDKRNKNGATARCKKCTDDYAKDPIIREKKKLNSKSWRLNNYEKDIEAKRQWRESNPEYLKKWREDHVLERQEYLESNKERIIQKRREWWYRTKYGITLEDKEALLIKQGNCCAICKDPIPNVHRGDLDHDHLTGKVRGILCSHCNRGLGGFRDTIAFLESAIVYLK